MQIARIYDDTPGRRVLVDRLWPRGIAKAQAPWDVWAKDLAPSNGLRKAYHDGLPFDAFAAAYREELADADLSLLRHEDVLVTAAKVGPNHAHVLRDVFLDA